jgi:uncharacterized integral membrane protein (TIGR00698 family)
MKMLSYLQNLAPGLLVTGAAATLSWFVGPMIPGLNSVIFGLLLGIVIGNLWTPTTNFQAGISFSSSKILEFAIVMMAFEINIMALSKVGLPILSIVLIAITAILFLTLFLSRKMSCPDANGWLIGFGTAICGSAAISALGPMITKDKAQIGISLAVINILGGLGIFFVPGLIPLLGLDATESGVLVGGSLHSMGHVAGAAALLDDEVRNVAISVKLVRIALLTPALILFSNIINTKKDVEAKFSLKLPLYLILFIAVSLFVSFVGVSKDVLGTTKLFSNIGLTLAMVGIGIGISFKKLLQSGMKALSFGIVILISFLTILLGLIWAFL